MRRHTLKIVEITIYKQYLKRTRTLYLSCHYSNKIYSKVLSFPMNGEPGNFFGIYRNSKSQLSSSRMSIHSYCSFWKNSHQNIDLVTHRTKDKGSLWSMRWYAYGLTYKILSYPRNVGIFLYSCTTWPESLMTFKIVLVFSRKEIFRT